jgi:hypothetical protein
MVFMVDQSFFRFLAGQRRARKVFVQEHRRTGFAGLQVLPP